MTIGCTPDGATSPDGEEPTDGMMWAIVLEHYGPPERLQPKQVPIPHPGKDDVLLRVRAASVNDWEYQMCQGELINRLMLGWRRPRRKIVLGCDVAGSVVSVGANVTAFKPGDEVYADLSGKRFGAFAEYARVPASELARKPAAMSFAEAAAIPQAAMLAVQGLIDIGGIRSGHKILLNGAGGGVGTFALQLAKLHADVEVTCVDSAAKLDMLSDLGADHVMDYQTQDFTRTGQRYDLILDPKTDRSPFAYARALKPGGTYATVGGAMPRLLLVFLLGRLFSLVGNKQLRIVALKPNKDNDYINNLYEEGRIVPIIDRTFRLSEISAAFQHFGAAKQKGKIILTMD